MDDAQDVMTPEHPQWREFCGRLDAALGGSPDGCNGDRFGRVAAAHENARAILATMGADVDRSIAFFEQHGGHCDCEILFNVDPEMGASAEQIAASEAKFDAFCGCLDARDPTALVALIRAKYPEDVERQRGVLDGLRACIDLDEPSATLATIEAAVRLLREPDA